MSKLKFIFILFICSGIFRDAHAESEPWGKPNAPVLVKIQELSKDGNIIELRGLIRSQLSGLKVEWKLPEGAVLVSGELQKSASLKADGSFVEESIKLDVTNAKDEPVVFVAYVLKNGERMGHSRVYKWNTSPAEQENLEKIKAKMKARKSKFIH